MEIKKCCSLDDVRSEIDRIDNDIVKLIAERERYVLQAAEFKKDSDGVKAPDRVEKVISKVRGKAEFYGADEDTVENIYRTMINCFINAEMKEFNKQKEVK